MTSKERQNNSLCYHLSGIFPMFVLLQRIKKKNLTMAWQSDSDV